VAIYSDLYKQQPGESFYDFLQRINRLRMSGVDMKAQPVQPLETPAVEQPLLGQEVVNVRADEDNSDPAPTAPGLTRQEIMERQIKQALGQGGSYAEVTRGLGAFNPLLAGFGYFADAMEKSSAALELGRQMGIEDPQRAKELGSAYLDNPDALKSLISEGKLASVDAGMLTGKRKPTMIERFFGIEPDNSDPPIVYDSIAAAQGRTGLPSYGSDYVLPTKQNTGLLSAGEIADMIDSRGSTVSSRDVTGFGNNKELSTAFVNRDPSINSSYRMNPFERQNTANAANPRDKFANTRLSTIELMNDSRDDYTPTTVEQAAANFMSDASRDFI
jgi:hypothetical protein